MTFFEDRFQRMKTRVIFYFPRGLLHYTSSTVSESMADMERMGWKTKRRIEMLN